MTSLLSRLKNREDSVGETMALLTGGGGMVVLTAVGLAASLTKLLAIAWVAFGAMMVGAWMGARSEEGASDATKQRGVGLVWAYGLSSGAMITSATLFLVPNAISHHAALGGLGIAVGIVGGFSIHTLHAGSGHTGGAARSVTWELTLHALGAGLVIGAVYAAMPALGSTLGLAIVSHKAPAGYAAARRLRRHGRSVLPLLLPAAAVGLTALPVGLADPPTLNGLHALVFGGATGLFLHVALDFLPRCEWRHGLHPGAAGGSGDRGGAAGGHAHRLRWRAIGSTLLGGAVVVAAWALL
jgi:ZIP family zinc transporter